MDKSVLQGITRALENLSSRLRKIETRPIRVPVWHYLTTPLTSTAWDGDDTFSTTARTLLDLSVVFGVPANVVAIDVRLLAKDTASGATTGLFTYLTPNSGGG